jgi:hypothetical protein
MMKVYLLTEEQKNQLLGQKFDNISYFNPVQDFNDNWIISEIEVNETINQDLLWVKDLPIIDFERKILPDLI